MNNFVTLKELCEDSDKPPTYVFKRTDHVITDRKRTGKGTFTKGKRIAIAIFDNSIIGTYHMHYSEVKKKLADTNLKASWDEFKKALIALEQVSKLGDRLL